MHAAHKTFADHRTHGAAHEVELETGGHQIDAVHCATHDHQGIGLTRVFQRFFQAVWVFAAVLELQGVHGQDLLPNFIAPFGVEKSVEARSG